MEAPKTIIDLVEKFHRNRESYCAAAYNETQVRREFIDPMFKALGWDIDNEKGRAEAYKDVVHEDSLKIGVTMKAPDYCFRTGGTRKFFLEAKRPGVNIRDDAAAAYQLRRYAWSAKLSLSIVTDFEEFAVYDCRIRPAVDDKASKARILYLTYKEYAIRWSEIAGIFGREEVFRGSFDRFAETTLGKRGTAEVDSAFLAEIEMWREALAHNIAKRNPRVTPRELNSAVQQTIDRIIFLRICEDRGIEEYGKLKQAGASSGVYANLFELFEQADERYNSGLFHFHEERNRPTIPDTLTPKLKVDDRPLKEIIRTLYYPDSAYEFSVLPADILGQVYEQFLGKVIRLTSEHVAKVEEKPEVRKQKGVYYTPTFVVDYIVARTLGKILEEKTPGPKGTASRVRVLDPACGSGSFLLGAYQYLLDWHLRAYTSDDPEKWTRGKNPPIFMRGSDEWRLTASERKRILLNNIYGVDIDPQAVEVTKLSLLLKVLERESAYSISQQYKFLHERALPDLGENIRCGNSLIGSDFYQEKLGLYDEEDTIRVNAFDWKKEFSRIFGEGGFDVVIGNPPYVRQETLSEFKDYFHTRYHVYHGIADLYAYFIELGVSLLKQDGVFSYIVANKWLRANYGEPLRAWLKEQHIEEIVDFGDLPVFKGATTYPCIIRISKKPPRETLDVAVAKTLEFESLAEHVKSNTFSVLTKSLDDRGWSLANQSTQQLLAKIKAAGVPLGKYVHNQIFRGVLTGLNEAFVIDATTRDRLISRDARSEELIKPLLVGKDVKRYEPPVAEHFLILIPDGFTRQQSGASRGTWKWFQTNFPAVASHLARFEGSAKKRCDKGENWWELRPCDYYSEFEKPKIIYPNICKRPEFTFDKRGLFSNQKCFVIPVEDLSLLAILNSSLSGFFFETVLPKLRGGFFEPSYVYFRQFPVVKVSRSDRSGIDNWAKLKKLATQMLALHRDISNCAAEHDRIVLSRRIEGTQKAIDVVVYDLYALTACEIATVEQTLISPP